MTAQELIKKLSKLPPNTTVCTIQHVAMEIKEVKFTEGAFFASDNLIKDESVIILY